jgi:hypothetical protein
MAETFPFGAKTSVFKVAGKMFALSQLAEHPLRVSLKCEPQLAEQLRATYSAVIPGYHLNKFVTGLYQASEVRDELDEPWHAGAMTIVIVLALMIVAYFIPETGACARWPSATSPPPEATMSRSRPPTNAACAWRGRSERSPVGWSSPRSSSWSPSRPVIPTGDLSARRARFAG